jgi:hypothetical protein
LFLLASLQTLANTKIVPHPIYVPAILPSHWLIFTSVQGGSDISGLLSILNCPIKK